MTDWMMAHPWMTFFLLMAVIEAVCKIVSAICTAIVSHQGTENGDNENGETTDISND